MITLTNAFDPGDFKPGVTYPNVKICRVDWQPFNKFITMWCEYGTDSGGNWTSSGITPTKVQINDKTGDYTTLIDEAVAQPGDVRGPNSYNVYEAVGRSLYEWLIAQGIYAGTVS